MTKTPHRILKSTFATNIFHKTREAVVSTAPIAILVVVLASVLFKMDAKIIVQFCFGTVFLMAGIVLFTLGAEMAMMPIGQEVSASLAKSKRLWVILVICFILGVLITIAEPDLQVLAKQLSGGATNFTLIICVGVGVGLFLIVFLLKTIFKVPLKWILLVFYAILFVLAIALSIVKPEMLGAAFDSGGVTTGPITVPFLMAFGVGLSASTHIGRNDGEDGFGMIALCSIGPIIAVIIMSFFTKGSVDFPSTAYPIASNFADTILIFFKSMPHYMLEVALALSPIVVVFILFQMFSLKLTKQYLIKICIGLLYTYVGLSLFLCAVNVGFMPLGNALGYAFATSTFKWWLIPVGVVFGVFVIIAEPAVHILNKQVEEITGGAISKRLMMIFMAIGIAIAIGLSMLRVLTGISIWWFLAPCYAISLLLSFFTPSIFTGIAFDSGGVASGPMTATFLLPFAIGACEATGGNPLFNAFGLVAYVAMMPILTIQVLGMIYKIKSRKKPSSPHIPTEVIDFDDEVVSENLLQKVKRKRKSRAKATAAKPSTSNIKTVVTKQKEENNDFTQSSIHNSGQREDSKTDKITE